MMCVFEGFEHHINNEHHIWAYIFFFIHLYDTKQCDYTSLELYVNRLVFIYSLTYLLLTTDGLASPAMGHWTTCPRPHQLPGHFQVITVVVVVALVERWTRDRKVAGSTPGRGAIKSTRSTRPSIPLG